MRTPGLSVVLCCLLVFAGVFCANEDPEDTLKSSVESAAGRLQSAASFKEAMEVIKEFREEGLILLSNSFGVYVHPNRELEDQDWSELKDARGNDVWKTDFEGPGTGVSFEYYGEGDVDPMKGYAFLFTAPSVPLSNPIAPERQQFILVGGFDYEPEQVEVPYEELPHADLFAPEYSAAYVQVQQSEEALRQFVDEAISFFTAALRSPVIDIVQTRRLFRVEGGPWRYVSTYIYILDDNGNVIFNGADRSREQTNWFRDQPAEFGELIRNIITTAKKPDGGFVRYDWDDPSVVGDEPRDGGPGGTSPKLAYVKAIPINKDTAKTEEETIYYIFGSGIYLGQAE